MIYAIGVRFKDRQSGTWSKGYTYKSTIPYEKGDLVVVPAGNWYTVGEVTVCKVPYDFNPEINYRYVIQKLDKELIK